MMSPPNTPDQRGLTIVEVLICIAIVTAVLTGAFVVTQRSVHSVRYAQEKSEATQLMQSQVEHVRALALSQNSSTGGIFAPGDFCIDANTMPATRAPANSGACLNRDNRYDISISYDAVTGIFTFKTTWDSFGGGLNEDRLSYRVYSGEFIPVNNPTP